MNKRRIIASLLAIGIITTIVNPSINISKNVRNITILANKDTNDNNSLILKGYWGGNPYVVTSIGVNNNKLTVPQGNTMYFSYAPHTEAYNIELLDENGKIIKEVTYDGSNSNHNVYSDFNGISVQNGYMLKVTSYGLNMAFESNDNIENINVGHSESKTVEYIINKNNLQAIKNNITINPIYFEVGQKDILVDGTTKANSKVNIWINGADYTTVSKNNGEYSVKITTKNSITENTKIRVFTDGDGSKEVSPQLNPKIYHLQDNNINISNVWNQNIGTLSFNPTNNTISFKKGWAEINPYMAKTKEAFSISLYDSNGKLIKSVKATGGEHPENSFYNIFNNLNYSYGDILKIDYKASSKITINNFNNQKNFNVDKSMQFKLTKGGLVTLSNNLSVDPIYYSIGSGKTTISGKTSSNERVNIWIDGKDYITTSDDKGIYNLDLNLQKPLTSTTDIEIFVNGQESKMLTPVINPNIYKIINNKVILIGNWCGGLYTAGYIGFNPVTMKLEVTGRMGNYFGNGQSKAFRIALYSKDGNLIKQEIYSNNDKMSTLYKDFNGVSFNYGDILKLSTLGNDELKVSNYNNQKEYLTNKVSQMKITESGLVNSNLSNIEINPLDILGNGKITSATLTGKINTANKEVIASVNGKDFIGKSDIKGNYSINIIDKSGFDTNTQVEVSTKGELTTLINPTADKHLGILKTNITISDKDQDGTYGQTISFDPATMTIKNSGGQNYAAQLISGTTGKVIASCDTSNFNIFNSKNDLNNTHFKYGDIISVYESKETELSMGELLLDNGKSKIDATNQFVSFEITPNGLVQVTNKDLITSKVLFKGNNNMIFTGKTLPNTNVVVTYSGNIQNIKSDSKGEFKILIPVSEAPIGSEVRVFVNSENNQNMIVNYDNKIINLNNNRIEIVNNTNVPIFNIIFDPVHDKLQAIRCNTIKDYTGAFYSNDLSIKLLNPKTGDIINSFEGNELNDINSFISQINGKRYSVGDVLEVSYNSDLVKANIYNGKTMIGNNTGSKEYFEINNKGLTNINNKFINVDPLNILGSTSTTHTNILGTLKPNTTINISVDGNIFKGKSDSAGKFSIAINDKKGFKKNTKIVVSADGYIPTIVTPELESNIKLQNSYINFYNSNGWMSELSSSITFNPYTMELVVNNYTKNFGDGNSPYFKFELYNSNRDIILNKSFNDGNTSDIYNYINGHHFNYGDIIGLSYNNLISKPVILNGNLALGNIDGTQEYFKITKNGLIKVVFSKEISTKENNKEVVSSTSENKKIVSTKDIKDIKTYINHLSLDINKEVKNDNINNIIDPGTLNDNIIIYNFVTRVGISNIENFYNKSSENKEFLNWLLNNTTAMQEYLEATNTNIDINGLQIWSDIWNKYINSRNGFNLKLAIAVSISNAKPISAWPGKGTVGNPVERYNIFESLNTEGGMLPIFKTLNVRHLEYVVNTHIANNQILEMRSIILQNHNGFIKSGTSGLNNIAYTIAYNEINPHTGASVFGPNFYGKNPTILDVWYDGGVCGATSYLGSSACQVFGIPAQPIGQPGHCAFIFDKGNGKWTIGNNIFGWSQSTGSDITGWSKGISINADVTNYDLLDENINLKTLKESNEYLWLANSEISYDAKMKAINKAISIEPLNVGGWIDKINLMKINKSLNVEDYLNLSNEIINALKDYPVPMYDLLLQIKDKILNNGTQSQYNQYVSNIINTLNNVKDKTQKQIAQQVLKGVSQQGIEINATPLINSSISLENVWSQAIGNIGFNPVTMKLTSVGGWSLVNPYLNKNIAFTIGLYGNDNKPIKTLTLIGGEHPEKDLYNTFNGLDFKYGDRIVIDYRTSSKIFINNGYKNGELQKSIDASSSCVYEITPKGLVYLDTF